ANFESWREANGLPLAERRGDGGPVTTRWQEVEGREAEVVMQRGRLADLIVIARPVVDTGFASLTALDAALFSTGRPVLVTPPAIGPGSYDRAVIAWNGSAEAASAVGHALPLLTGIERVGVYSASEPKRQPRAEALIDYLDWHGIAA